MPHGLQIVHRGSIPGAASTSPTCASRRRSCANGARAASRGSAPPSRSTPSRRFVSAVSPLRRCHQTVNWRRQRRTTGRSTDSTRNPSGIIQKPSTGKKPRRPPATSRMPSPMRIGFDCGRCQWRLKGGFCGPSRAWARGGSKPDIRPMRGRRNPAVVAPAAGSADGAKLWKAPLPFAIYHVVAPLDLSALCSPVAQLVEQAAVNRWVAGSSPARGAN